MFRIIIPAYNSDKYIAEALDSILCQEECLEEIYVYLVNDASTDDTLKICEEYEGKYPDNIKLINLKKNGGVSHARNIALKQCISEMAEDDLVGFLDSDDKFDLKAFKAVKEYFDKHKDVNLAISKRYYFDAVETEHRLNWRFENKEVVDIKTDWNYPNYYVGGAFFRKKALKYLVFDESMDFWEDALAINIVIIREGHYGLMGDVIYYYRKRQDDSSLVSQAWLDEKRYNEFLDQGYMRLMNECRKLKWRVIPYIQFVVAYHLRIFMMNSKKEVVKGVLDSRDELDDFWERLRTVLKRISKKVIVNLPTSLPIIECQLSIKAGKIIRAKRVYKDGDVLFICNKKVLARLSERNIRLLHIVHYPELPQYEGMWRGRFCSPVYAMREKDYVFAINNGEKVISKKYRCNKSLHILGRKQRGWQYAGFMIDIPKSWEKARFGIHIAEFDQDILMNEIVFDEVEQVFWENPVEEDL